MTIEEALNPNRGRRIAKTVGEVLGLSNSNAAETTPQQRIAERQRRIAEIKTELQRLGSRDFRSMSVSDRNLHRSLHDEWALLATQNFDDEATAQREEQTAEKQRMRKSRPVAISEARARLSELRKCAASVANGTPLGEQDRRRLRLAISAAEIEVQELTR